MVATLSKRKLMIGVGAILLALLLLSIFIDWQTVLEDIHAADPNWMAAAALFLVLGYVIYALRWHVLLIDKPRFAWTFHASNAGNLVNLLLPLRPGDAARILMLGTKDHMSPINVTTSIIIERWYEQIMRIAALGGAIVFGVGLEVSSLTIAGSLLYLVIVFWGMIFLVRHKEWVCTTAPRYLAKIPKLSTLKAEEWTSTFMEGMSQLTQLRSQAWAFVWSLICWVAFGAFHYATLRGLFPQLALSQALGITFGSLALVPPSATTFPGYFQASLIIPLALVGFNRYLLDTFAIVLNIIEILVVLVLGIWGVVKIGVPLKRLLEISAANSDAQDTSGETAHSGG